MRLEGDMENSVRKIPVVVDENNINGGALKILEVIRSSWEKENVTFKLLTDGITNKLVGCNLKDGRDDDTVLVRVYGNKTDLLIDRKAETKNIILLNKVGLAPRLYATFENGLAYEFVPGCTLSSKTVAQPHIYKLVARHMAKLHKAVVSNGTTHQPVLWRKFQDFFNLVPDEFSDTSKKERFEKFVMSKRQIRQELDFLKEKLSKLGSPVVFAHNDLLLGNVIYTESKNKVTFIDFEYASFNYQAYDIGNHFAEFVGLDNIDYSKYPSKQLQFRWLEEYLHEYLGSGVKREQIEKLYVQVNQFALASHLFWGIWALIQAEHSYIDFDFLEYASIRFNEYLDRKEEFFSLGSPSESSRPKL